MFKHIKKHLPFPTYDLTCIKIDDTPEDAFNQVCDFIKEQGFTIDRINSRDCGIQDLIINGIWYSVFFSYVTCDDTIKYSAELRKRC